MNLLTLWMNLLTLWMNLLTLQIINFCNIFHDPMKANPVNSHVFMLIFNFFP